MNNSPVEYLLTKISIQKTYPKFPVNFLTFALKTLDPRDMFYRPRKRDIRLILKKNVHIFNIPHKNCFLLFVKCKKYFLFWYIHSDKQLKFLLSIFLFWLPLDYLKLLIFTLKWLIFLTKKLLAPYWQSEIFEAQIIICIHILIQGHNLRK